MESLFSASQGVSLILIYAVVMIGVTLIVRAQSSNLSGFIVGGRDISAWPAGLSIAATWIWAPALLIAAQQAYTNGIAGLFWFTVPNVACLVLFGFFAARLRRMFPHGYTLSGYMRERYSDRVQNLYLFQFATLSMCAFAVQLLAGGAVLSLLTGIPFAVVTLSLAAIALAYSLWAGLRASVLTDWIQMILILGVALTVIPWAISASGGWGAVTAGAYGAGERITGLFDANVFLTFGLATTIGLLSGPFGDQSFWQRAFAVKEREVKRAFFIGAGIFALVPLTLSIPGFLAAGSGFVPTSAQLVSVEYLAATLPAWVIVPVVFMLLSGLVSTLDSCLCAASSLAGHDAARRWAPEGDGLRIARWGMLGLAVGGIAIANIPGLQILYLFLLYGTLRASTLLPTVLTILGARLTERSVFIGILTAICVGLPIFAYGNFGGGVEWVVTGSLTTVLSSGLIALALSAYERRRVAL